MPYDVFLVDILWQDFKSCQNVNFSKPGKEINAEIDFMFAYGFVYSIFTLFKFA
jgi:hypothetical protein